MKSILVLLPCPLKNGNNYNYLKPLRNMFQDILPAYPVQIAYVSPKYIPGKLKVAQINNLRPAIETVISTYNPSIILAFGDVVFKTLEMEDTRITEICGKPEKYKKDPNIWIYPTFNYDALMSFAVGYKGVGCLEYQLHRIGEILGESSWKSYTPEDFTSTVKIHMDVQEAIASLPKWKEAKSYAFDIETAGPGIPIEAQLNPYHPEAKIVMIALGNDKCVDVYNTMEFPELIPYIKKVLENKRTHVSWNGNFDIGFLTYLWGVNFEGHLHIDGMVVQYLRAIELQYMKTGTLKFASTHYMKDGSKFAGYQKNAGIDLAIKYIKKGKVTKAWKEFVKTQGLPKELTGPEYLGMHMPEYCLYCGIDVLVTYKTVTTLYMELDKKQKGMVQNYYRELIDGPLMDMEKTGIHVDEKKLDSFIQELTEITEDIKSKLLAFEPLLNPNSSPQLKLYLQQRLGIIIELDDDDEDMGDFDTSYETLSKYVEKDLFCKYLLEYRGCKKQLEQLNSIKKYTVNGFCHTRYSATRVASGRCAAYEPNIQQVPEYFCITSPFKGTEEESIHPIRKPVINVFPFITQFQTEWGNLFQEKYDFSKDPLLINSCIETPDIWLNSLQERLKDAKKLKVKTKRKKVQGIPPGFEKLVNCALELRQKLSENREAQVTPRKSLKHKEVKKGMLRETTPLFKDIFIPDNPETDIFLYADFKQLEVYVLANYIYFCSKDESLQKALLEGKDIHSYTASLLYSVLDCKEYTYDFIYSHKEEEPYKTWRSNSKAVIFG